MTVACVALRVVGMLSTSSANFAERIPELMQLFNRAIVMRRYGRRSAYVSCCRAITAAIAGVLLTVGFPPQANAHSVLESSSPAKDSAVAAAPPEAVLTFNEPLDPGFTELTVIGPDGVSHWEGGKPAIIGPRLSAPLNPLGPAGRYTLHYRVVSADGHPVSGTFSFTLTTPGPATAAPAAVQAEAPPAAPAAAPAAREDAIPAWPWIVGAVILLVAGAAVAMRIGRGPDRNP